MRWVVMHSKSRVVFAATLKTGRRFASGVLARLGNGDVGDVMRVGDTNEDVKVDLVHGHRLDQDEVIAQHCADQVHHVLGAGWGRVVVGGTDRSGRRHLFP